MGLGDEWGRRGVSMIECLFNMYIACSVLVPQENKNKTLMLLLCPSAPRASLLSSGKTELEELCTHNVPCCGVVPYHRPKSTSALSTG